jgi:hypothetical protein
MTDISSPLKADVDRTPVQTQSEQNVSQKFLDEVHNACQPDFGKSAYKYLSNAALFGGAGAVLGSTIEPGFGSAVGAALGIVGGIDAAHTDLDKDSQICEDSRINQHLNDTLNSLRGQPQ